MYISQVRSVTKMLDFWARQINHSLECMGTQLKGEKQVLYIHCYAEATRVNVLERLANDSILSTIAERLPPRGPKIVTWTPLASSWRPTMSPQGHFTHFTHAMAEYGGPNLPDKFFLPVRTYLDVAVAWRRLSTCSLLIAPCSLLMVWMRLLAVVVYLGAGWVN